MNDRYYRTRSSVISCIVKFLKNYKTYLIIFSIVFLIGIITGILTCMEYSADVTCENLINKYLYNFLINEVNFFSLFLSMGIMLVIVVCLVGILTRNKFFVILDGILLSLMAYVYGFDLCIICNCLGLSGVIFGILFWGVLGVCIFALIIIIFSIACKRVRDYKNSCKSFSNSDYFKLYICITILTLVVLLVMCILFSIIHIFVIVE